MSRTSRSLIPAVAALVVLIAPGLAAAPAAAQETGSISGTVTTAAGVPVPGAQVVLAALNRGALSRGDGAFLIPGVPPGTYTLEVAMLGHRSASLQVDVRAGQQARAEFVLAADPLKLDALVVTGTQSPRVRHDAPIAISVVSSQEIEQARPRSTTEMLRYVPGFTRVESSGGEVNQNITMRGILGVEYVMFMEDGMPVFPTMHTFFMNADNLFRPDENIERMEVVRGGSSALFGSSTPGAIVNFINKPGGPSLNGTMKATAATEGLARYDAQVGGPLGEDWRFNVGGFYRYDHGVRDPGFPGVRGGQFKASLTRLMDNGHLRASVKAIDDRNQFILPLPFENPDDPDFVSGFSDYGSMNTREGNHIRVPIPTGELELPLDDGLRTKAVWLTGDAQFEFGNGWLMRNTAQLMNNDQGWNALLPFDVMSLNDWLVSQSFPAGSTQEVFYTNHTDPTGEPLAFSTGNGLVSPGGLWHVEKPMSAFQDQLSLRKTIGDHTLSAAVYFANYTQTNRWYFTEVLMDVRDNPRFLDVVVDDAGTPIEWTKNGFRNYLSNYVNGTGHTTIVSANVGGSLQLMDRLRADVGARFEVNDFVQSSENTATVDLDGDATTRYDNVLWGDGTFRHFSRKMDDWAASLGLNYSLTNNVSIYGLGARAYKMPALDEFLTAQAADQVDLFDSREVRTIEGGVKYSTNTFGASLTGFYVQLTNIISQGAVTDPGTGQITWIVQTSPENVSKGAELELASSPVPGLTLFAGGTVLKSELGTGAGADIGSWINGVPPVIGNFAATFDTGPLTLLGDFHYVGRRYNDFTNDITMEAYHYANVGVSYRIAQHGLTIAADALNAYQSKGMEELNPRLIAGARSNIFLARPILPRRFSLSVRHDF